MHILTGFQYKSLLRDTLKRSVVDEFPSFEFKIILQFKGDPDPAGKMFGIRITGF